MNLLKTLNSTKQIRVVREDVTAAGDVAGSRGLLFNTPMSMIRRFTDDFNKDYNNAPASNKTKKKKTLGLKEAFCAIKENEEFDQTDVIAKLKSLEKKEAADQRDTVAFGVEDDNGQLVRVHVKSEQAEEFERALQVAILDVQEDEYSNTEIAEILYNMKDQFDIVDVEWPEIQEDEEEEQPVFDEEQGEPGLDGAEGDLGDDLGGDMDVGTSGDDEVKSLLTQVIDMMKADASARKADAEARIADAKAREQELGAKQALAKIKQEEQFLDMDEYEKKQKAQDKEAKRLAQLAKWKHEMSGAGNVDADMDDDMGLPPSNGPIASPRSGSSGFEDEEINRTVQRRIGKMLPSELAKTILGRMK